MANLPLTGGCLCTGVRFEVTEAPVSASWCHCKRCQRRTGTSASPQARFPATALRVLQGGELLREYEPAASWAKAFCSTCGSSLWSRSPDGDRVAIRFGVFDTDPGIRPQYRQFVAYAAAWDPIPDDGLPRYAERVPPSL